MWDSFKYPLQYNTLSPYEGYGTIFVATPLRSGNILDKSDISSFYDAVVIAIKLTEIVKKYHDAGYLHLDIKSSNIFKDDNETNLYMFDFDSLCKVTDVSVDVCTDEWAAPELRNGNNNAVCAATDIYSIGAVFYWLLFNRQKPNENAESVVLLKSSFSNRASLKEYLIRESTLLNGYGRNLDEVSEHIVGILTKTLASSPKSRYQSADELLNSLNGLEALTRPNNTITDLFLIKNEDKIREDIIILPAHIDGYNNTLEKGEKLVEALELSNRVNPQPPEIINLLKGYVASYSGDNDKADVYNEEALLPLFRRIFDMVQIPVPDDIFEYVLKGDFEKDIKNISGTLEKHKNYSRIEKIEYNHNDDDAVSVFNNGIHCLLNNNPDSAIENFKSALEKFEKKPLSKGHINIISCNQYIGRSYLQKNEPDKALRYLSVALHVQEINWTDHPRTAETYSLMGCVYAMKSDTDNALLYFKKALKIYCEHWGDGHSETLKILNAIAELEKSLHQ